MAAPISNVSCPICGKILAFSVINQHIDQCLGIGKVSLMDDERKSRDDLSCHRPQKRQKVISEEVLETEPTTSTTSSMSKDGKFDEADIRSVPQEKLLQPRRSDTKMPSHASGTSATAVQGKIPWMQKQTHKTQGTILLSPKKDLSTQKVKSEEKLDSTCSSQKVFPSMTSSKKLTDGKNIPLAERMRPTDIENYIGQSNIVGPRKQLRRLLDTGDVPSLILWGPPGCGKVSISQD